MALEEPRKPLKKKETKAARFRVVSQNRLKTADGSDLKVLDVALGAPTMRLVPGIPVVKRASSANTFVYDIYMQRTEEQPEVEGANAPSLAAVDADEEDFIFSDHESVDDYQTDDEDSN
ncbi:hypothetical protein HK101_005345, partial [Irineochytrium annulatum]